jgi:hypothetical protein
MGAIQDQGAAAIREAVTELFQMRLLENLRTK